MPPLAPSCTPCCHRPPGNNVWGGQGEEEERRGHSTAGVQTCNVHQRFQLFQAWLFTRRTRRRTSRRVNRTKHENQNKHQQRCLCHHRPNSNVWYLNVQTSVVTELFFTSTEDQQHIVCRAVNCVFRSTLRDSCLETGHHFNCSLTT